MPLDLETLDREYEAGTLPASVSRLRTSQQQVIDRLTRPTGPAAPEPMRERQEGYVWYLLRKLKEVNPEAGESGTEWFTRRKPTMTKDEASDWINRIKAKIADGAVSAPVENVRADMPDTWAEWRKLAAELVQRGNSTGARYAVDTEEGATNKTAFWWISEGKGIYKGRFFLRQVIGGRGAVRVRMSPEAMVAVARKILEDPSRAMVRYGQELGVCGACGTELTNDESRAYGIGPECRRKGRG